MKKILSVFLALVMLCGLLTVPASAAGSGSLRMGSASGYRGDTVTLNVKLNSNPGLVTMTIRVSYDTSVLQLTNVSNPGLLVGAQLNSNYGSPYTISWVDGATTTNNMATGTIASFTFKILENAKFGDSTVSLQFVDSYDTDYNENSFSAASGKVTVKCNHNYGSWSDAGNGQHSRTCSVCSGKETANHTWNDGNVTKKPSCKEEGVKTYTCTTCNATKTEAIDKTDDHSFGGWVKVDDATHKSTCAICDKAETAAHTWNSGVVTKKATCKEEGVKTYTCTGCNATKTEVIEKLTTHTYDHACDTDCNVCGVTRTITHNYKTKWSKDKTNHWHECSVCKDKKDVAKHTPGKEATETTAQTCTECGYVIKPALGHKHKFATEWTTDEAGHWYTCSGCDDKGSYADHDFENACDTDCSICGYTRETAHSFGEQWSSDAEKHWHACEGCGAVDAEAAHEPGAEATATTAQTCTICGYEIAPALGEPEVPTEEPTQPTETEPVQPSGDEAGEFPWWIVVVIGAAAIAAAVVIVINKKKK